MKVGYEMIMMIWLFDSEWTLTVALQLNNDLTNKDFLFEIFSGVMECKMSEMMKITIPHWNMNMSRS